jgi:hypothetical protein
VPLVVSDVSTAITYVMHTSLVPSQISSSWSIPILAAAVSEEAAVAHNGQGQHSYACLGDRLVYF